MAVKYVFVTGGVVSGLGKGITAASLGRLLKARGFQVTMQKFDPYINIDPGTMNPIRHGEVFVTDDGTETDLDLGGTLRLGSYPCVLADGSLSLELFGQKEIQERHRHRYEVNNAYRKELAEKGMTIAGTSPDGHIVEMIEIPANPFFVGTQGHPEFKSRPNHAHPLFRGFIQAAVDKVNKEETLNQQ